MATTDDRRESGLWTQNTSTGYYEKQSPTSGPYQYYQPPQRNSTGGDRRSFAERAGDNPIADSSSLTFPPPSVAIASAATNAAKRLDTDRARDVALATHEKILASDEHADLVRRLHEHGEADSAHFAKTAHLSDAFPAAMAIGMGETGSRTLSETRHVNETLPGLLEQEGDRDLEANTGGADHITPGDLLTSVGGSGSESFSKTKHVNETSLPGSSAQPPLTLDTMAGADESIPENLRTEEWGAAEATASHQPSNASENLARRSSVPDRSPLQNLERVTSKESKRARAEEAEARAVQRQNTLRSEKGRVVSDGSRRSGESTSDKFYANSPRQVSAPGPMDRFQRASDALKSGYSTGGYAPPIASEPRPYRHAPEMPRSMDSQRRSGVVPRTRGIPQQGLSGTPPIAREARPYHHAPEAPRSLNVAQYPHNLSRLGGDQRRSLDNQPAIASDPRPYHHAPEAPRSVNVAQYPHNLSGMSGDQQSRSLDGAPHISNQPQPYHHAPEAPRSGHVAAYPHNMPDASDDQQQQQQQQRSFDGAPYDESEDLTRSASGNYRHRLRDAGYVGAAAAATTAAGVGLYEATSTVRDQESYESPQSNSIGRSGSKKLQKARPKDRTSMDSQQRDTGGSTRNDLQSDRTGGELGASGDDRRAAEANQEPDPLSRRAVATGRHDPLPYSVPPQTAAGQAARRQVGFGDERLPGGEQQNGFSGGYQDGSQARGYQASTALEDWRGAQAARLTTGDLEFEKDVSDGAWWEKNQRQSGSSRSAQPSLSAAQYDGPYEEEAKRFEPPMYLKCGPLIRYTGIRRDGEREIWRGSVMIVTEDEQSDYSTVPTLRLFAQAMDLFQPPPKHLLESGQELPPEYEDPIAGQVKVSRTGRPIYVRPAHDLHGGVDLSRKEDNEGLYAAWRTPVLGPQSSTAPDGRQSQHITFQNKTRIKGRDGEKAGKYQDVPAIKLHTERGFTFWRWSLEIELGSQQHRVAYRINRGPALGFWVPARGETMNVMFHSCNGFSMSVDSNLFSGPDPLWRDVLNKHQARPFHVMIGGGDQIYNDAAMRDTTLFREWLQAKSPEWKNGAAFSAEMQHELEEFYLNRYSMWFSQGLFAMAGSQIPMVNVWDDHDIIDGYGSYPHHFMSSNVFAGLGAIAFKYYMLFQHQSLVAETTKDEPSWVLGASPGPYINELSRSIFLDLGRKVKFLGIDCRTERMRDEILSEQSYDILFDRCRDEITHGETRHLIVLLGVPIAYPRLNFLENILTSRMMDPIKAIGRTGMLGGFVNKFDGGVEILDDLDDHWTAKHHKAERNWFIQELQELAAEKSVRVTILGGDVHLGAVGQFYTPKNFGISKDRDHRYMPNVISSAIVNTPPPTMMADVLNKRNKVHHLDHETDEDLIPMFEVDVDGSKRNNKCLLPHRNYCTIREFQPGHTPPPSPPPERNIPGLEFPDAGQDGEQRDRRFPPGSMASRTMSLTRGPAKLVRRLSGSRSRSSQDQGANGMARSNSMDTPRPQPTTGEPQRPTFHRRPTNLSEKEIRKAVAKGGAPDEEGAEDGREVGHINLEGGLDIRLNMEIDQHNPSGATQYYRLLVPALWYAGAPDVNTSRIKSRGGTIMDRFRGRGKKTDGAYDDSGMPPSPPPEGQMQGNRDQYATGAPNVKPPYAYGTDGAYGDVRNGGNPRQNGQATAAAYGQGYNLSGPPIGSSQQGPPPQQQRQAQVPTYQPTQGTTYQQQSQGPTYQQQSQGPTYPYGQPGNRNISAPIPQKHTQQLPYGREQDEYSEGSVTSDEYVDARDRQPRRLNKAERFFGIGSGGRTTMQNDGAYVDAAPAKKKPNWMVWK